MERREGRTRRGTGGAEPLVLGRRLTEKGRQQEGEAFLTSRRCRIGMPDGGWQKRGRPGTVLLVPETRRVIRRTPKCPPMSCRASGEHSSDDGSDNRTASSQGSQFRRVFARKDRPSMIPLRGSTWRIRSENCSGHCIVQRAPNRGGGSIPCMTRSIGQMSCVKPGVVCKQMGEPQESME
jgi:hypothetical protein